MNENYIVYVRTDSNGNIIATNSSAFLISTDGLVQIDEGIGDKYHHAQGNYFDKPIMTDTGVYRYKYLADGTTKWREKTDMEIAEEEATLPKASQTDAERLAQLEQLVADLASLQLGV